MKSEWDNYWRHNPSRLGLFFLKDAREKASKYISSMGLYNPTCLDIGCGSGDTLKMLKSSGCNACGIDFSEKSISRCLSRDLDAFTCPADDISFNDNSFQIVFSEGLLEHYEDAKPIVSEMCRVSKKYVILIQPSHFSIFSKMAKAYYFLFPSKHNVKEITRSLDYFKLLFRDNGFSTIKVERTLLGAFWIIVFKRDII